MDKKAKIYVSGSSGMVGSSLSVLLRRRGYCRLVTRELDELDLRDQAAVEKFFRSERPQYVFHLAARVGGIKANTVYPAEFLYDNLMIAGNVIHAAYKYGVKKLLYLGSSCVYPRRCPQPMKEEYLLSGKLEPTNEGYALAKIAGLKLCQVYNRQYHTDFVCLMPPNLYGIKDNFDPDSSHVVPALIRKFLEAKAKAAPNVEVWGTGLARREFLYVKDAAAACLYFMEKYQAKDLPGFINVGYGRDVSIKELVGMISRETGYKGKVKWNTSMPDGMPRKLMDSGLSRKFGWRPKYCLPVGIRETIDWYRKKRGA